MTTGPIRLGFGALKSRSGGLYFSDFRLTYDKFCAPVHPRRLDEFPVALGAQVLGFCEVRSSHSSSSTRWRLPHYSALASTACLIHVVSRRWRRRHSNPPQSPPPRLPLPTPNTQSVEEYPTKYKLRFEIFRNIGNRGADKSEIKPKTLGVFAVGVASRPRFGRFVIYEASKVHENRPTRTGVMTIQT